jgi:hypothetical protein
MLNNKHEFRGEGEEEEEEREEGLSLPNLTTFGHACHLSEKALPRQFKRRRKR